MARQVLLYAWAYLRAHPRSKQHHHRKQKQQQKDETAHLPRMTPACTLFTASLPAPKLQSGIKHTGKRRKNSKITPCFSATLFFQCRQLEEEVKMQFSSVHQPQ
ncbi:hypothetical protein TRVL_07243 [Trypanosoma vivax]|nr:hypothetical protein TRVL_07243 [Trypanosoma vivax]